MSGVWHGVLRACLLPATLLLATGDALADGGVAIVGPMSGRYEAIGTAMRTAAEAAAADLGEQDDTEDLVKLVYDDDACDSAKAAEAARGIVARRPDIVIGHPCSSAAVAAAPVYAAAGIAFISTGARHPDLTTKRAGPLVFRLAGRDDRQGEAAAQYLLAVASSGPVAILHDRTFQMSGLAADLAARLAVSGHAATQYPFVAGEFSYDGLAAKVLAPDARGTPGAIFFAGYPAEAIVILRALRAHGATVPFLGGNVLATGDLGPAIAGLPEAKFGPVRVLVSTDGEPQGNNGEGSAVGRRTAAALEMWMALSRDDAAVGGQTIEKKLQRLQNEQFRTAAGLVSFAPNGDVRLPSYIVSAWHDGGWAPEAGAVDGSPP